MTGIYVLTNILCHGWPPESLWSLARVCLILGWQERTDACPHWMATDLKSTDTNSLLVGQSSGIGTWSKACFTCSSISHWTARKMHELGKSGSDVNSDALQFVSTLGSYGLSIPKTEALSPLARLSTPPVSPWQSEFPGFWYSDITILFHLGQLPG